MKEISVENQIYLCKYWDIDKSLHTTIGLNEKQVTETLERLKRNGLYEQYRKLNDEEYEKIILKEKKQKSKIDKILENYNFNKSLKGFNNFKEVLNIANTYNNAEEICLEKIFRTIAEKENVKSYTINNNCKRILDDAYSENIKKFEENKYYKKPTLREFILQELNLQDVTIKENICESKEKVNEVKENVICNITPEKIEDIDNTFVKVSVKTVMEWSYQKRIFR